MTDEELLQMVKAALEANPDAGCSSSRAQECSDTTLATEYARQHAYMLAASVRHTWAYQQRARQLRAGGI